MQLVNGCWQHHVIVHYIITLCFYYAMLKFPFLFQLCFHLGTYYAQNSLKINPKNFIKL